MVVTYTDFVILKVHSFTCLNAENKAHCIPFSGPNCVNNRKAVVLRTHWLINCAAWGRGVVLVLHGVYFLFFIFF